MNYPISTILLLVLSIMAQVDISSAASFDCSKATSIVDRSICADPVVSGLDEDLAKVYSKARVDSNFSNELLENQRAWLRTRNDCGNNSSCLVKSYRERIAQLNRINTATQNTVSQPLVQPSQSGRAPSIRSAVSNTLATLDGNWHSPQWKYGYVLKDGMGVATSTNSPNFQVGQNIIQLSATSPNTFTGQQVYTDGKFYKVTVTLQTDGRLYFEGEKNTKWVMERIGVPPQASSAAFQTSAAAPSTISTLQQPLAQSTQTQPAASPLFPAPTQTNQVVSPSSRIQTSNAGSGDQPKVQTVIVEGLGIDIQSAAQNAARNALTNVVGSLIDTQSMLNKRTQIEDGIRTQTKAITSSIKEYSQGSIQSFEILDTKTEGGLYRVSAKVSVRIEDFRAYIKKLAEGETAVEASLFTRSAIQNDQTRNKVDLINDLLRPLISGEVIRFDVEKPTALSESKYKGGDAQLNSIIQKNGIENVFLIKVNASIDPSFLQNMRRVIQETSSAHVSLINNPNRQSCGKSASTFNPQLDTMFAFYGTGFNLGGMPIDPNSIVDIYMTKGVASKLDKLPWGHPWNISTSLEVAVLGDNAQVLQRERFGASSTSNLKLFRNDGHSQDIPWVFATYRDVCETSSFSARGVAIVESRSYTLAIAINKNALQQAKKIVVRLIQ
jgi:uncharacterized protein